MTYLNNSRRGHTLTARVAALCLFAAAALLSPGTARAQWTQPDASGNINNTNTGNVGVGTNAPDSKLTVSGNTAAAPAPNAGTLAHFVGANATTARLLIDNFGTNMASIDLRKANNTAASPTALIAGSGIGQITWQGYGATGFGSGSRLKITGYASENWTDTAQGAHLTFQTTPLGGTATAEVMRLDSRGFLGIGTSAPVTRLDVADSAANGSAARFVQSNATASNGVYIQTQTASASDLALTVASNAGATVGLAVRNNGNVGVGTSTPSQRLDVAGNVNASGLCLGGDCKTAWSQVGGSSQWTTNGSNVYFNTGNVGLGVASPVSKLHVGGQADNLLQVVSTGSAATDTVANFSSAVGAAMIIRGNGNVGIGTGTPVSPLEVSKAQAAVTLFQVTNANAGAGNGAAVRMFTSGNNALTLGAHENAGAGGYASINQEANLPLLFKTSNAERIRITGAGNVGIGTATPGEALTVNGRGVFGNINTHTLLYSTFDSHTNSVLEVGHGTPHSAVTPFPALVLSNNTTSTDNATGHIGQLAFANRQIADGNDKRLAVVTSWVDGATNSGTLQFYTMGAGTLAERLRITSGGNVGVGVVAPSQKLDVAGNVNAAGLCLGGDCKTAWSQVGGTSQWTTSGTSINYSTGNVGLGTAAPSAKLHIISADDTVSPALSVRQDTNPLYGFDITLDTNVNGNLSFNRVNNGASASVLAFDRAGGNVGIGTTTPLGKLSVVGGANTALLVGDRGMSGSVGLQFLGSGYRHAGVRFDGDSVVVESASISHVPSTWHGGGQALNFIVRSGNVGINKTNPTEALDVVGNITATGNIAAKFQDVAEWVPSTQRLAPGTVVVLDRGRSNHVLASTSSYDTGVAGVVSAQPGVILGEGGAGKLMVATTGRVRIKVDATHAPILIGDLLVTSDVAGVAMKSEPVAFGSRKMHAPGTIIGKALEPLASGTGEILVLLSLQ